MKKVWVLFSLVAGSAWGQITWTKAWTGSTSGASGTFYNGYHDIHYDSFTNQTWVLSTDTATGADSIYSSRLHYFNSSAGTDTLVGTSNQPANGGCLSSSATWPFTHHPVGQIWIDSIRNRLWIMEGVGCTFIYPEQWYYQLDNPISGHTNWVQVYPPHLPTQQYAKGPNGVVATTVGGSFNNASVVHDIDHDAFFLFGYDGGSNSHAMQVYCDTSQNPTPGTLTTAQLSVGCAHPDDWTDITSQTKCASGSTCLSAGGAGWVPPGYYYPNLEYDSVHHQVIQFAGLYGESTIENQTWIYNMVSKTWTQMNPANPPANSSANNENGRVAHAFNTNDGKYYYHLTAHAPSGGLAPTQPPQDWVYDPVANTWTELSVGQGPFLTETMTYDSGCNCLVAWAAQVDSGGIYEATGIAEMWVGTFGVANPIAPTITTTSPLTQASQNSAYSVGLSAAGSTPMTWTLTSGTLPSGLSLSSSGVLSGTPTATGTYAFAVQVANSAGTAGPQSFSLTIVSQTAGGTPPTITSASSSTLTAAVQWGAYTYSFAATGTTPISWSATGLPSGLSMNSSGVISGESTSAGTFTLAVTASNSAGSAQGNFSLTVTPARWIGHSTYNCVDVDGDGYGVGPGCLGPDADDTDAGVHSASDALSKWDTLAAFWSHLGYTPNKVLFVDGGTGSCTRVASPYVYSAPTACASIDVAISAMSPGDAVVVRGGTYNRTTVINLGSGTLNGTTCSAISYYLSYPGELPDFEWNSNSNGMGFANSTQSCFTVDGIKLNQSCLANGSCSGGGYGIANSATVYGATLSHMDIAGFTDEVFVQYNQMGTQILHNYIHDAYAGGDFGHDIYLGSNVTTSTGTVIAGNIISNANQTCLHANGPMTNILVDSNLMYGCEDAFNLQSGISQSTFQNNVVHTNGKYLFEIDTYANSYSSNTWQCHNENNNIIRNNTFFEDAQTFDASRVVADAGSSAIYVADDGSCLAQAGVTPDLGHNTYDNNILIHDCGTICTDYQGPIIRYADFGTGNATAWLQSDTYRNNVLNNFDISTSIIDPTGTNVPQNCTWFATTANVPGASGNICGSNPDFVAANPQWSTTPGSWNLEVSSGSPALAAGLASDAPTYDIMGIARGTPPTIGAYEHIPVPSSACDLNGDGIVNVVDVQIAVNQALGIVPCGSADLQNNGTCNVVDVQRVIVAALGGECLVGP
jgi:hypothetical protein